MGFGMRLMPGVRVSVSGRGVRTSLGPRAARIHVGAGRPGVSTGAGPFTSWTSLGGSRRSSGGSRAPSMAAYERQLRAAERQAELEHWAELQKQLVALATVHQERFAPAQRPVVPPPEAVPYAVILQRHEQHQLQGISVFKRAERKA